MEQASRIFISHDQEDAAFARKLAADLQRLGIATWMAPDDISPGEGWVEAISRGIEESSHMVVAVTPSAIQSRWVQKEIDVGIALERQGRMQVIPLEVEKCSMPLIWGSYQTVAFEEDYQAGLSRLTSVLGHGAASEVAEGVPEEYPAGGVDEAGSWEMASRSLGVRWELIRAIFAKFVSGVDITPNSDVIEDLGMDDLDIVELTMEFEECFEIEIGDNVVYEPPSNDLKLKTVKDWWEVVAARVQALV